MQSGGGQYGVPDQFVVQRPAPPHLFTLGHEIPLPVAGHGHHHLQHQHQQQHHQPQHHHPQHHHQQQHPQHHHQQQHPQHHPQQQQQQHPHQHPQHAHQHHVQQQQQQQQHPQHAHQQHAQQQQQQQQAMVQQLGLGPDSPEAPSPAGSRPSPTNYKPRDSLGDDEGAEEEGRNTGGNRWPRQETLALIKIRSEMDSNFRDSGLKGPLWEDVSRRLGELGYRRSSKKCKEKFENVHKYYKKTKDGRAGRQDGKSYRFFSQLEALYGGGGSGSHGDGGNLMLTAAGSQAAIGGGAEGSGPMQRPADSSGGMRLSSDSEDDYDDPGDGEDLEKSKKRKRRDAKVLSKMVYFEGFLKRFVEKQEAMQRKFLDALERREQERLVREESWKRQEMARVAREHEMRAQEHALAATRDAALVAFLQKVTGQTLTLPPVAPSQALTVVTPEVPQVDLEHPEKESFDPNSKRWPRAEVQALIRLRSQLEPRFQEAGPKGPLWEEICTGMTCLGFSRNAKRCKEKWENINKYFRKTKETHRKRPDNAKTCPYFHQLDILYRKGVLGTPTSKLKMDENSDDLADHPSTREDSENDHGRDAEDVLSILPPGDGPTGVSTSNGGATHFFSSPGNGSSGERVAKKVKKQPPMLASPKNGDHCSAAVLELNFDGLHDRGDGGKFSGNDKLMRLEGMVNRMMDQQQQQQHVMKFEEGLEGEDQEREMGEHETRQQENHSYSFSEERVRVSSRDSSLIALVQKLAGGEPSEFPMSAPPSSE